MEAMVKGYLIRQAAQFILDRPDIKDRVPKAIVDLAQKDVTSRNVNGWYPRGDLVVHWRALAQSQPSDAEAARMLNECGEVTGSYAIGTFLKLLLKVLTPRMFAKKFPDLYRRDNQGGHIEIEAVEDHRLVMWIKDVEGYDHFSQIGMGWCGLALKSMGLNGLKLESGPWSRNEPGPRDFCFVATWQ